MGLNNNTMRIKTTKILLQYHKNCHSSRENNNLQNKISIIAKNLQSASKQAIPTETVMLFIYPEWYLIGARAWWHWWCGITVTVTHTGVVLQWCYSGVTVVWFYSSYLRGRSQLGKVNGVLSDAWRAARICAGSTSVYYIYNSTQLDNNSIWSETSPFCWRHTNLHRIYNEVVNYSTKCVMAIHVWMDQNMLKLNPNKTEFMVIGNINKRIIAGHIFRVELLNRHFAEIDSGCTCSIWSRPFVQKTYWAADVLRHLL